MRRFIIYTITLCFFQFSYSQDKAKEILDKVSTKMKSYETIISQFDFILENPSENIKEKHSGKIYLKGDKYKLELMNVETYYDGKTQYSYLQDVNEVNISEPDPSEEDFLNPTKLFTIYEDNFLRKFISEKSENSKQVLLIELIPENLDQEYSKVHLKIDKKTYHIISLKAFGLEGDNTIISLESFETNKPLDDKLFAVDLQNPKYKDVEVIDMR